MDLPDNKKNTNHNNSRIARVLAFLLLVLGMLFISYLVYLKSNNIDIAEVSIKELFKGEVLLQGPAQKKGGVEIPYNPKDHPSFSVYKNYIVKCSNDSVKFLDKNGEEIWEKNIPVVNPIVKTNGTDLLIADYESKEVFLFKDKELKWNTKIDNKIINADISASGHAVVVHEMKGYKGAVTVFNLQGGTFFTRNLAEGFVISAKVSPKGKQVFINALETGGISAASAMELTDMLGNPTGTKIMIEDTVFPSVGYLDNETIAAVSEDRVVCWNKEGKEKWKALFEGKEIYSSSIREGKGIVLAVSSDRKAGILSGAATTIVAVNSEGKQSELYSLQDRVKNLETEEDVIAINTGSEVHFVNTKGKLLGKHSSKLDITEVRFFNRSEALVITNASVEVVEIN